VWRREPGKGSYARPERERRFLLRALPDGSVDPVDIEDRYIVGTRLRLRRMSDGTGAPTYKLAQKVPDRADPSLVMITNTYLSEAEYDTLLAALPALTVLKTRYRLPGPVALSVDDFRGPLAGLVLAELEGAGSQGWRPGAGLPEAPLRPTRWPRSPTTPGSRAGSWRGRERATFGACWPPSRAFPIPTSRRVWTRARWAWPSRTTGGRRPDLPGRPRDAGPCPLASWPGSRWGAPDGRRPVPSGWR